MAVRTSSAEWQGDLKSGAGTVELGSGAFKGAYTFASRFEDAPATNPEELIAAAHAGCFAMAFSHELSQAGHVPKSVKAKANVHLKVDDSGISIPRIDLECVADVPGIDKSSFDRIAEGAKTGCPVSKVLAAAEITLKATLVGG